MGTEGTIYLITPSYEDMDSHGVVLQTRAHSEPPMNPRRLDGSLTRPTRSLEYLPLAPPMPMHYGTSMELEVSSHGHTISYVPVYHIMLDQSRVILYRNDMGAYYRTNMSPTQFYPFENVINVHHNARGEPIKLEDDLKNCYTVVLGYELGTYTWESIPIDLHFVRATTKHFHGVLERPRPSVVMRERSMPLPLVEGATFHAHSKEGLVPIDELKGSTILAKFPFPRVERKRGKKGGEGKTLRPSTPQKFCKKFDGTGDPYDHVAQYRQLLFAKGITNVHTMVQAFGLTIEG